MLSLVSIFLVGLGFSLGVGTQQSESHPSLSWQNCSAKGSCQSVSGSIVLDSNWRWLHDSGTTNCYDGNEWSTDLCPDASTCDKNCYIEGADYSGTYGITSSGAQLKLGFVTKGSYSTNIGSRVYLLRDESHYQLFKLKNHEFTFTVDDSQLPCGLNGALYFVEMAEDGGAKPGAQYGMGYCDAQCPHDMKFITGEANVKDWKPQETDENAGNGHYGACCTEMDIWEANSQATAYTPHICSKTGIYRCEGTECGDNDANQRYNGVCDKDGCDFNSYRLGNKTFWGPGLTVDSNKAMIVVTQFTTSNNQDSGELSEIRRIYVQGGKTIQNSDTNVQGITTTNKITQAFCDETKVTFGDTNDFKAKGGFSGLSKSLESGAVLVLSLWDDHSVNMLWLDSTYPTDSAGKPGADRGPCAITSGDPKDVESQSPNASVTFSDIKFGPIDSTY
uniref:cellulose 1,4-beta-cellobiosidase (non-reducing end) n=1 Tax=uncultured symbiotic protist of Hodotermopsis sjoestedti TaxID=403659 RepID=A4UWT3_9EUKA|nr:putative glycosyl hydrolase family7 [uncultured symbiotic protist of Hodotermopsis sjoestedti]